MQVVSKRCLRALLLTSVYLLGALGIMATGGGSGSGDDGGSNTGTSLISFIIEKPVSETIDNSFVLTVQVTYIWRFPYHESYHYLFPVHWNNDLTGDSGSGEVEFSRECWIWGIQYPSSPGVTKSNYSTLPNGNKISNAGLSPFLKQSITVSTYQDYYFVVTSNPGGEESAESMEVMARPEPSSLSFDIKTFRFDWFELPSAEHYKLLENPDGISGFSQVGSDIPQGTYTFEHFVPLFKRINASYILQSCVGVDCDDFGFFTITGNLVAAIGYIKASNIDASDRFGRSVSLSGDGNTLVVGSSGSGSGAVFLY